METSKKLVEIIPANEMKNENGNGEGDTLIRVAAYARVSTGEADQQNSYNAQIEYYKKYIKEHPEWKLVKVYADSGISGTQAKNRTEFNRMINMARRGRVDLILCKSISRFARNTVDLLEYVRKLRTLNVGVIFEKENIDTRNMNSEFILSLYASFAQAESESISRNITWGIEKSFRKGKVRYNFSQMIGYKMGSDGHPEIVEEEAEIVRFIFESFISGVSMGEIANRLSAAGVIRKNGSVIWNRKNVEQILRNEKYAGFAILQKTFTVDCLTHQREKNIGQKPLYIVKNCHDAIISPETFKMAEREFKRRSEMTLQGRRLSTTEPEEDGMQEKDDDLLFPQQRKRVHKKYILSSLLVCGYCGSGYRRVIWKSNDKRYAVYRCGNRLDHGTGFCAGSPSIHEDEIRDRLMKAIKKHFKNLKDDLADSKDIDEIIGCYIKRVTVERKKMGIDYRF